MKVFFAAKDYNFTDKVGQFVATDINVAIGYTPNKGALMYAGNKLFSAEIDLNLLSYSYDLRGESWQDIKTYINDKFYEKWGKSYQCYSKKISTEEGRIEWFNLGYNIVELKNICDVGLGGNRPTYDVITTNYWIAKPELLSNVQEITEF